MMMNSQTELIDALRLLPQASRFGSDILVQVPWHYLEL